MQDTLIKSRQLVYRIKKQVVLIEDITESFYLSNISAQVPGFNRVL